MKKILVAIVIGFMFLPAESEAVAPDLTIQCTPWDCPDVPNAMLEAWFKFLTFMNCPGALCLIEDDETYIVDVEVKDVEICKKIHYRITINIEPEETWQGSPPMPVPELSGEQHCATSIFGDHGCPVQGPGNNN